MKNYGAKSEILLDQLGQKYMKIKLKLKIYGNSDDDLSLKKMQGKKYYPQVFLEKCLYKF